jgi:glycosyltransferase involved in cell wall biosynthesis
MADLSLVANPTFSVVVPAYNTGAMIESGIRSVFLQSRDDFELIIIDDGSTDDTVERVRPFLADPRVRLIQQANRGASAARNTGLAVARGEFVTMLDSDDLLFPDYLRVMNSAFERSPDAGLAYTDAHVLDHQTGKIRRTTMMKYQRPPEVPPADAAQFFRLLLDRNFICPAATLRRSVLEKIGGFDERLSHAEDWELWLRTAHAGHGAVRPPGTLAVHRDRPSSLSTNLPKMIEGMLEVYRIVEQEYETGDDVRTFARKKRAYWDRYLRVQTDPALVRSPAARFRALARALKRRALARRLWFDVPPPEVASVLRACGVLSDNGSGTRAEQHLLESRSRPG